MIFSFLQQCLDHHGSDLLLDIYCVPALREAGLSHAFPPSSLLQPLPSPRMDEDSKAHRGEVTCWMSQGRCITEI